MIGVQWVFVLSLLVSLVLGQDNNATVGPAKPELPPLGPDALPGWVEGNLGFNPQTFQHCFAQHVHIEDVDESRAVVCWLADPTANKITFGAAIRFEGAELNEPWAALGISDSGGMYGADIALFSPSFGIEDLFSLAFARPGVDAFNDLELVTEMRGIPVQNGAQGNVMSFVFSRKIKMCAGRENEDLDILPNVNNVIWSVGDGGSAPEAIHKHKFMGSIPLDLLSLSATPIHEILRPESYEGVSEIVAEVPLRVSDPNQPDLGVNLGDFASSEHVHDVKMCVGIPLPTVEEDLHVFEIEVIRNTSFLHHMRLDICEGTNVPTTPQSTCSHSTCYNFMAWNKGAFTRYRYPEDVGEPVPNGNTHYAIISIHYYNPEGVSLKGVRESSGMVLRLGPKRTHAAGRFGVDINSFSIPEGLTADDEGSGVHAYLPGECLPENTPELFLLDGQFHMHGQARRGLLQSFHNEEQVAPLAYHHYFDYEYQGLISLNHTFGRNDYLKLTCSYDSTAGPVRSGGKGDDEMCKFFILYYPKITNWGFVSTRSGKTYCPHDRHAHTPPAYTHEPLPPVIHEEC